MLKTYTGSCHCGAVRFEADLDIGTGVVELYAPTYATRVLTAAAWAVAGTYRRAGWFGPDKPI